MMMRSILMMMRIKVLMEERGNCEAENCDQDKNRNGETFVIMMMANILMMMTNILMMMTNEI